MINKIVNINIVGLRTVHFQKKTMFSCLRRIGRGGRPIFQLLPQNLSGNNV